MLAFVLLSTSLHANAGVRAIDGFPGVACVQTITGDVLLILNSDIGLRLQSIGLSDTGLTKSYCLSGSVENKLPFLYICEKQPVLCSYRLDFLCHRQASSAPRTNLKK